MLCAIFCFVYFHTIVCFIRSTFFCCFSAFEPINNGFFSVRIHIHTIFIENRFAHTQQRRQKLGNWHAYNCKKRSKKKSIFFPLFAFKRCWYVYVYVCVSGVRMKSSFPLSLSYGGFVFVVLLIFRWLNTNELKLSPNILKWWMVAVCHLSIYSIYIVSIYFVCQNLFWRSLFEYALFLVTFLFFLLLLRLIFISNLIGL